MAETEETLAARIQQLLEDRGSDNTAKIKYLVDTSDDPLIHKNEALGDAVFCDVKLSGAVFYDVDLSGAFISDANLSGVNITNANIDGLTIDGFEIARLIAAERSRQSEEDVAP